MQEFLIATVSRKLALWLACALMSAIGGGTTIAQTPPTVQPSPPPTVTPKPVLPPIVPVKTLAQPGIDDQIWGSAGQQGDRQALIAAIDHSLRYLQTDRAAAAYRRYPVRGVTLWRVRRSLQRFRQLVLSAKSAKELQAAIDREFVLYRATGKDGQGTVAFTGYYEPIHVASRVRTEKFRYPVFRRPSDFSSWQKPHPTRLQLEGADGLQFDRGKLKGLALAWLPDRLEAFLIQVQGSARLKLTDGTTMTIGYAGHTDYLYTGVGRELVKAGKFTLEELTLPRLLQHFQANPADLDVYLPRNQRFVFFRETGGAPATGSIGVPVTPDRSIATDKALFPPGALALIQAQLPYPNTSGQLEQRFVSRFVLDQDTGGAIKGPGRVDVFMGTGQRATDRAGLVNTNGSLYYLLLKP